MALVRLIEPTQITRSREREGHVEVLGVDPQLRRRGIGTAAEAGGLHACDRTRDRCMVARQLSPLIPGNLRPAPLVLGR